MAKKATRRATPREMQETAEDQADSSDLRGLNDNPGPAITGSELARHLDLTPARISAMANEGLLPRNNDGSFPQDACRVAYIRYIRRSAIKRAKHGDAGKGLADARLMKVKMDIAVQQGQLVNIDDVEANFVEAASKLRSTLGGIGASVTRDLALRALIDEKVNDGIDQFRAALEASAEADFSDSADDVEGEEAAA